MVGFVVGFGAETVRWWFQWGSQCRNGWCSSSLTSIPMLGSWVGCWGHGVWLLCGSLWIAYLGFKISDCVYLCALGLGILTVRFLFFFFCPFNWLLVFWLSLRLLWWWLCRGFYFCGCGLIFLGSCGLILLVVAVEELAVGSGSGGGLNEVVVAVVGFIILF